MFNRLHRKFFQRDVTFDREGENGEVKHVKRTLFGQMNPYPQKKVITFNKHVNDFSFNVVYADLDHLSAKEIEVIGDLNLSHILVNQVKEALSKHEGPNAESKGIKAHFNLDESGLLNLVNIELVVEKNVTGEEEGESTLQKIGSSFSKFFGGSEPPAPKEDERPVTETPEEASPESGEKETSDSKEKSGESKEKPDSPKEEKVEKKEGDSKNATEAEKEKKPKIVIYKEPVTTVEEKFGVKDISEDQLTNSLKKIKILNDYDEQKQRKEKAQNALESYVFDAQNKLDTEEYQQAASADEKSSILAACQEMANWLEEDGYDADANSYEEKLTILKTLTGPLYRRVKEHQERPDILAALNSMINGSEVFLQKIREATQQSLDKGEETMFTEVEITTLEKVVSEVKDWKLSSEQEQSKLPLSEAPKLTVRSITEKMGALDREVKYLVNKAKIWKPKTPGKKNETAEEVKIEPGEGETTEEPNVGATTEEPSSETPSEEGVIENEINEETDPPSDHQEL